MNPVGIQKCRKPKGECNNSRHGEIFIPCDRIGFVSRTYTINEQPKPLARPRFHRNRVYDSQKDLKFAMGIELRQQHENNQPIDGVLHFDVDFYFPYPKAKNKKMQLEMQKYHNYKPDISNLIKMVEDVCVDANIITDDCIISSIFSRKLYSDRPRTELIITQILPREKDEK